MAARAILEAFSPGVHGAQAIAETLFGVNNPGGKLPVTIYPAAYVDQIDFLSMDMSAAPGRSYRYYTGTPLFPFGWGLSYTTFELAWAPQPPPSAQLLAASTEPLEYKVTVTNSGERAGDEVVLAFVKAVGESLRSLPAATPLEK